MYKTFSFVYFCIVFILIYFNYFIIFRYILVIYSCCGCYTYII